MGEAANSNPTGAIDRWLGPAALTAFLAVALAATLRRIWATDFWWQYAAGAYVREHGWPTLDAFSYTAGDRPWIELHWLFAVAQHALLEALGPWILVVGKMLAVVLAFLLVSWPWLRRGVLVPTSAVLLTALLASSHRFFVRPELVTYVMLGAFVLVLDRYRREGGRAIWCLPLLQVVWVNCHPMALLGPLLVGLCGFTLCLSFVTRREPDPRRTRRLQALVTLFAATVLAMAVNPYGLEAFRLPLVMFSEMRDSMFRVVIGELHSPFSFGLRWVALRWFYVLVVLAVGTTAWNWRRLDPFWGILALSQFYLASSSIRNLPLFCLAAVPFVLSNLERSSALARLRGVRGVRARRILAALVVLIGMWWVQQWVTDRASVRQNDTGQRGLGIALHRFPQDVTATLLDNPPGGRVFATLLESAYLTAHDVPVFADPRLEVYGEAIFTEYLSAQRDIARFRAMADRRDVRAVLVGLRTPLARDLLEEPRWRLVDFDTVAALFYRDDARPELAAIEGDAAWEEALRRVRATLPPAVSWDDAGPLTRVVSPQPYLALADFLRWAGRPSPAAALLDEAIAAAPFADGLQRRVAALREADDDPRGVVEAATQAVRQDPTDYRSMARLGEAHFRLQAFDQARTWLERSLEGLPSRALTWSTLSRVHMNARDLPEAERCLRRAVELDPTEAVYRANLARVVGLQGRTDEAIAGLEAAVGLDAGNASFYVDLVQLHGMAGNRSAAEDYLRRGLTVAPEDPGLLRLRAALERAP